MTWRYGNHRKKIPIRMTMLKYGNQMMTSLLKIMLKFGKTTRIIQMMMTIQTQCHSHKELNLISSMTMMFQLKVHYHQHLNSVRI